MAPFQKKSKTKKKTKKFKKHKQVSLVPVEPRTSETDWWDSFWHKNSTTPGIVSVLKISFPFKVSNFNDLPLIAVMGMLLQCYHWTNCQQFCCVCLVGKEISGFSSQTPLF